jgi:hypothetical protein
MARPDVCSAGEHLYGRAYDVRLSQAGLLRKRSSICCGRVNEHIRKLVRLEKAIKGPQSPTLESSCGRYPAAAHNKPRLASA